MYAAGDRIICAFLVPLLFLSPLLSVFSLVSNVVGHIGNNKAPSKETPLSTVLPLVWDVAQCWYPPHFGHRGLVGSGRTWAASASSLAAQHRQARAEPDYPKNPPLRQGPTIFT